MTHWVIRSERVEATVNAMGGMIAPAIFALASGRRISPFKIAPWSERAEAAALPPVTRYLRGEFACVPFGAPAPPPSTPQAWRDLFVAHPSFSEVHGVCANHDWGLLDKSTDAVTIGIDYPSEHPIARVEKTVRAAEELSVTLRVFARRPTRISIGVHPVFDIGEAPDSVEIAVSFKFGRTFPGDYAPGLSRLTQDARFEAMKAVPLRDGSFADISRLPLPFPAEDVAQLCGTGGRFRLTRTDPAYSLELTWDAETFPSVLLGIANGGRREPPYDGAWRALYVEPVAAAFGMGSSIGADQNNPIAREGVRTCIELSPSAPWTTTFRFAAYDHSPA